MRIANRIPKSLLIALGICATSVGTTFSQWCWYSLTETYRCSPSVGPPACPSCYQEFCSSPINPTHCDFRYTPEVCGGEDCDNQPVQCTINYRNTDCWAAGTGPDPTQTTQYCYGYRNGVPIPWLQKQGPLCDKAVIIGKCGSCSGG
jgi:hypothetical protein